MRTAGFAMERKESNARYYSATADRIILREEELRPSTILELIDCLRELELSKNDRRIERLERLHVEITGEKPSA